MKHHLLEQISLARGPILMVVFLVVCVGVVFLLDPKPVRHSHDGYVVADFLTLSDTTTKLHGFSLSALPPL